MIASSLRLLNSTRLGTILQTLLYVSGLPYFSEKYSIYKGMELGRGLAKEIYQGPHPEDPTNIFCYGELGCVTLKYSQERGFHLFPLPIQQIQPQVCLHTGGEGGWRRNNRVGKRESCQNVDRDSLADIQRGNGSKATWIAHGYLESSETPWVEEMVRELLEYDMSLNVFVIDWGAAAKPPYTQAVANLPLLAAYTGELMMLIQEVYDLKIRHIHFIGHSLGAHLAGLTGSWLKDQRGGEMLGRISGLDPAQPYFQKYPPDARLDPSDAIKVDVIHTDAKPMLNEGFNGLGIEDAIGHVDFYPNNGKDQPGCNAPLYQQVVAERGSLIRGLKRMVGCDHMRSYEYFIESIRSSCSFSAFACSSWAEFISSGCNVTCEDNESCLRMGFHTWDGNDSVEESLDMGARNNESGSNDVRSALNKTRIAPQSYYLITGNKGPFCREHYLVTVHVGGFSQFFSKVKFNLVFRQRRAFPQTVQLEERDLRRNFTQTYLVADSGLVDMETEEIDLEIVPAFSEKTLDKYEKQIKLGASTC